jgi:AcrR family transcriptional regulator
MTGVRRAMAEDTRQRVVDTARRLFSEKGYFATSTTEIVEAAGVGTRGALYHHFESKQALFRAVFEAVEVDLGDRVAVALSATSWFERLRQALSAFLDAAVEESDVRRILLIDGPAVLGWELWREIEARYGLGAIRHMLDEGAKEGSLVVADSEAMCHLLLSVVDEAALYIAHAANPKQARRGAGGSLDALLAGLATP